MSVVDEARELVQSRIAALDGERGKLSRALNELGGSPKPARRATQSGRKRGRPKGRKGTRADEAVKLIQANKDGITASEIAKAMRIKPNYLYRVLGELEKEKRVRKVGRTYFPV